MGLSKQGYVSMGTSVGHLKTPWDQGGRSRREHRKGLNPVPMGSEPSPAPRRGSHYCQTGFSPTAASLLRGGHLHNPQRRPGTPRSRRQWGTRQRAGRKREPAQGDLEVGCPPLPFPLAPARPLEGWSATGGPQVPSSVLGRSVAGGALPETLLGFPSFRCSQTPEQTFQSTRASAALQMEALEGGHWVSTARRALCDGAALGTGV